MEFMNSPENFNPCVHQSNQSTVLMYPNTNTHSDKLASKAVHSLIILSVTGTLYVMYISC